MGQLYLVRHGQANSHATTEEDYDRLSELGHKQATLLGQWVDTHEAPFDLVISGTMQRHVETANGMGFTPNHKDSRLNEMNYFALVHEMQRIHGLTPPSTSDDFAVHMPQTFTAWEQGSIAGSEPFSAFETRIRSALSDLAHPGKRVLCVTSGGVIAMAMRASLGLGITQTAQILLPIYNSSLHRFHVRAQGHVLASFNTIPHLDHPDQSGHRTHY